MKSIILCDERLPIAAKLKLGEYGELIEILTENITYAAISGHPDIFCCQVGKVLVISPALPRHYIDILNFNKVNWVYGTLEQNHLKYPGSAKYNAVVTDNLLIHNLLITDSKIKKLSGSRKQINVNQGYTRCNLLPLPGEIFITSDKGINSILTLEGFEILYVNPEGVQLEGFQNGFIGGVCGVRGDNVFIAGNLSRYKEGQRVKEFLSVHLLKPVELYDGPLIDCGSIIFI